MNILYIISIHYTIWILIIKYIILRVISLLLFFLGEENYVPDMKRVGLWDDIGSIRSALTYHTESLMFNLNNNAAENYNSILAKFVGGKRVNLCLRGSYELRCNAAVTAYNVGANRLSLFHKQVAQKSRGLFTKR